MNDDRSMVRTAARPQPVESFEGPAVPDYWQVAGSGCLSLSIRHYKDGQQSLCWTWTDGTPLRCSGLMLDPEKHPNAGMQGWVYCEKPISGRLNFQLGSVQGLAAGNPDYSFHFRLNFTGWRAFQVQFKTDARVADGNQTTRIEVLEIVPPESASSGTIYLDAIRFSDAIPANRSADYQIPEHAGDPTGDASGMTLHYMQQSPVEPLPAAITAAQRQDFATIFRRYRTWLLGERPDLSRPVLRAGAEQTRAYIVRGWEKFRALGLQRNVEGGIVGPGLPMGRGPHNFQPIFTGIMLPLVFDWKLNGNEAARDGAFLLFDYVHDQGWAEGSARGCLQLNILIFSPYIHAIAMMRDELHATGRLETAERAALWYLNFGKSFSCFDGSFIETSADELRSIVFTSLVLLLGMDDSPRKVQYMRGWLSWFNSALEVSPRFAGVFKPDGTGFHHRGIYAGAYAPQAYAFSSIIAWLLHGTEFAIASKSIANLKAALITQDVLTNTYDVPYTTMGRMPRPGLRVFAAYAYLALASEPADPEMAGIFMRLWNPDLECLQPVLSVIPDGLQPPGGLQVMQALADRNLPASPPPQGFWSKPWGALAIHRRGDWLVSVKGWSQYVWDFEMHPNTWAPKEKNWGPRIENVYARYWSYGTLQPITSGCPRNPVASGWNLDQGWDWCRWPGATCPHLRPDELYDPETSWATRFFSAETFVGAVSSEGRNGVFALKIHEHFYDPGFRALKTYFFFDDEIICLGSNIETRDDRHETGTTLFQCWMPEEDMPMLVDGETITAFPFSFSGQSGRKLTLLDPCGNGYVLPDATSIRLERGMQKSRDAWNLGDTSGAFSTCWLSHGRPPREDGCGAVRYEYAMLIQTNREALAAYTAAPPYRVLQQDHRAHILRHERHLTTAYVLFETDWMVPHGIVRKTDTPVLVMVKETASGIRLSLADPDLRLPKRRNMGSIDKEAAETPGKPSTVRLELRGCWTLADGTRDVTVSVCTPATTVLSFDCCDGKTVEVVLLPAPGCGMHSVSGSPRTH